MKNHLRYYDLKSMQYDYIFECMYDSCMVADGDVELVNNGEVCEKNDKILLENLSECFNHYDCEYERKRTPSFTSRLAWWLSGLPSAINIDFEKYKIIQIGKSWGLCKTEKEEDEFIEEWFRMISFSIFELLLHYNTRYNISHEY